MLKHFKNLPGAEQEKIIGACRQEFAKKGYARASTNVMVEGADIPKGTLFYFFGSKKKLFLYIVDMAVNTYRTFVETNSGKLPSELFARMFFMVEVRMRFAVEEPGWYGFLAKALLDIPEALKQEMAERFTDYSQANRRFMCDGLDTSRLRPEVPLDQVLDVVGMLQEGMLARYSQQLKMMEAEETLRFVEELKTITQQQFDLLKNGVYRTD
jgi:AcrR family transcriptional regulator